MSDRTPLHPALRIDDVHVRFGEHRVLRGASLDIEAGEIVGLLGANGAGKSTLLSVVSGRRRPDAGCVYVGRDDILRRGRRGARLLGIAPQDLAIYPTLTVRENLVGMGRLHGLNRRHARARAEEVAQALGLDARLGDAADRLSGGQKRRLHTGMAIMHAPRVLLLDEPTVGADVESRRQLLDVVRGLAREGAAVLYTTHYLAEIEELGARVAILREGRVRSYGGVGGLVDTAGAGRIRVRTTAAPPRVEGWRWEDGWLVAEASPRPTGETLARCLQDLTAATVDVSEIDVQPPSLENAYLRLLGEDAGRTIDQEAAR